MVFDPWNREDTAYITVREYKRMLSTNTTLDIMETSRNEHIILPFIRWPWKSILSFLKKWNWAFHMEDNIKGL